jgi:phage-related protein
MFPEGRPLVWLHGRIRSPPFSKAARLEAGHLLRRLQEGERLGLPHSRPMPVIGPRCHELRIHDENASWRIVYCLAPDEVVLLDVFEKKSRRTPFHVIQACRLRLKRHEEER